MIGIERTGNAVGMVQHQFELSGLPVETVFELFCDPRRLNDLTPSWFNLFVSNLEDAPLGVGSRIDYRMQWRGLTMGWQSLISELERPHWLVYEQSRGPFREFRHEHSFVMHEGSVKVTDRILYRVFGGRWLGRMLVEPDLERILRFREQAARELLERDQATIGISL
jgi:ligand-binding SRPBCC domain-containing protein